jgi:hypothetical protein
MAYPACKKTIITIDVVTISATPSNRARSIIFKRIKKVRPKAYTAATTIKTLERRSLNVMMRFMENFHQNLYKMLDLKKPSFIEKKQIHRMGYSIPNSQIDDKSPAGSRKQDASR